MDPRRAEVPPAPPPLPSLNATAPSARVGLFLRKLKLCEEALDFSDPTAQFSLKETKRQHLVDIAEYVSTNKGVFNTQTYAPFMQMVSANVLRAPPLSTSPTRQFEPDDDEPVLEPAWPHLQVVYELLRKFVVSGDTDSKEGRACMTVEFVMAIVELFVSEDPREREYLKTILHRIYGKVMPLRAPIRKAIMNVFHRVVYETQRHTGVAELLEILGSIINGFAVPLKEEHKQLLRKGLLPLHIPAGMPAYHVQLSFCVTQFVEKDSTLAAEVVTTLVKHWPATHSRKEVMLLNEVEEVTELSPAKELESAVGALFRRVGRCIESPHFQVAERALFYWNNEAVMRLIVRYREVVMREVVGPLQRNAVGHWNSNVLSLSVNVQKLMRELDAGLFERCMRDVEAHERDEGRREAERARRWGVVYRMAQERGLANKRGNSGNGGNGGHGKKVKGKEAGGEDDGSGQNGEAGVVVQEVAVREPAKA